MDNTPDSIFVTPNFERRWFTKAIDDESTEYVRKDTFISKACKFLQDRIDIPHSIGCDSGELDAGDYLEYATQRLEVANQIIEEFKKYLQ